MLHYQAAVGDEGSWGGLDVIGVDFGNGVPYLVPVAGGGVVSVGEGSFLASFKSGMISSSSIGQRMCAGRLKIADVVVE